MAKENFVGIDVSKGSLNTYSTGTSSRCQYENTDEGLKEVGCRTGEGSSEVDFI